MEFEGKSIIVTGAGRGIGFAIARAMAGAGASVVLADIDAARGQAAAEAIGPRAVFHATDIAREEQVARLVAFTIERLGRIDALINNAAISRGVPLAQLSLDDWRRVLEVNLTAPMLCAKHAGPSLSATHGTIVNIASTRALMSEANTEAYSASKGGLVALTHALAISMGPAVRVNCISPGWIDTRADVVASESPPPHSAADHAQHPAGRVGTPDDIAEMALFLCGPRAGFITGQNFTVDGGMTRKMIYVE